MVEKVITLEQVSLIDFLGAENANIKLVVDAFPNSKIVSRGNEIRIKGNPQEIIHVNEIINLMKDYYDKYGKVSTESVEAILNHGKKEVNKDLPEDILLYGAKGSKITPKTVNQKKLVDSSKKNDLVFAIGPAGTGKTFISVALAVKALKNKEVKKIVITRPAVEAGENLGFLPGDLKEKIDPYLRPIYDALYEMIPSEKLKYYMENRVIEIAPLAYMRGRTLDHAFILLDEAQNTTSMQIKMFLTRMGPQSKVIISGDWSQIDLPRHQKSGLVEAMKVLKDVKGIGNVTLSAEDVIRHKLVKDIIAAYDKYEEKNEKDKGRAV
ncbi:MAG: PhoH family protein [Cyclobacteriaceae bacterium]|nr:PhoH family protein [Cyclobacteriaceae bacterium]MCH8516039.1 PhoH family protein [Cyclobacteriaceae bacterium]